jgi:hypothetical protein
MEGKKSFTWYQGNTKPGKCRKPLAGSLHFVSRKERHEAERAEILFAGSIHEKNPQRYPAPPAVKPSGSIHTKKGFQNKRETKWNSHEACINQTDLFGKPLAERLLSGFLLVTGQKNKYFK